VTTAATLTAGTRVWVYRVGWATVLSELGGKRAGEEPVTRHWLVPLSFDTGGAHFVRAADLALSAPYPART